MGFHFTNKERKLVGLNADSNDDFNSDFNDDLNIVFDSDLMWFEWWFHWISLAKIGGNWISNLSYGVQPI